MSDFLLTPQQINLRDEARQFARNEVPRQLLIDMDAEKVRYPREYIQKLAERHLLGLRFPQEWGGRGLDWSHEVLALEEILDRREGWARGRHSEDYRVIVFGAPGDDAWGWRFEGHHLSVSMTVAGDRVSPAPVFLGANPARVDHAGRTVLRPLAVEEDLGHELLRSLPAAARSRAVVAGEAPYDIRSATRPVSTRLSPAGIARADLRPGERALLDQLVAVHLGRLPDELAAALDPAGGDVHFAWEGPPGPGTRHYYRIQAADLLIEFDNTTDDGNHAHSVLRRPHGDFGGDILAAHRAGVPHS